MLRQVPLALVCFRLLLGFAVFGLCWAPPTPPLRQLLAGLVVLGLLSDIFDGIIARRLGVATAKLRRLDSSVDTIFWLCVVAGVVRFCPRFLPNNAGWIGVVLGLEALTYGVSYARFRKEIALHTLGAKLWTLLLTAMLLQLLLTGQTGWLFGACVALGIVSRLEILGIVCILRSWAADIPTLYHALQLRRGQPIRRHPLFNG
ncbi:CDP-alcohol phosphatidyltransferase family protein [Hymenobacter cellulosivorans]|uniref:CDP-alcohol phosphatidyltransferase family protein n=1 Tax=Hymenobacter cellulosivorans TaxID=2932249 RepID=A0ABY4F3N5_9BACT|nr:CDP-alcohol phosphatidyltransferase family protein [Hymenobacter cellulosivorans]UOQ50772.1 CDP-alcohol phosphatidyltransferase family protein [Hymenobacter cellulosivorans]